MMKVNTLTGYSFIFILFIFCHHIGIYPGGGSLGVSLFFILGGAKMCFGYGERVESQEFHYGSYLKKRLTKFYPVHWLTLVIAILISIPVTVNSDYIIRLALNAGLLHSWVPIGRFYLSFNSVSWYLANTVFFTAAFPFVYNIVKCNWKLVGGVYLILYVFLILFLPKTLYHAILYIFPLVRLGDFIVGILIGLLVKELVKRKEVEEWCKTKIHILVLTEIIALLCCMAISFYISKSALVHVSVLYWFPAIVFFVSICLRGTYKTFRIEPLFNWLGSLTFAFFMCHTLCIKFFNPYFKDLGVNDIIRGGLLLFISVMVAIVIHYWFEKPIDGLIKRVLI